MSNVLLTIVFSTVILVLCLLGMGISLLLTGKNRLKGSCGGMENLKDAGLEDGFCPVCKKKPDSCEEEKTEDK